MSLELRKIRMKNWKCYRDETIELRPSNSGNIWIIFGQNGFGKTSIQEAIRWCLYGGSAIVPSRLVDFFNRQARKEEPQLELSVGVELHTGGGDTYNVSRTVRRVVKGESVSVKGHNYPSVRLNGVDQDDPRAHVEQLLPEPCSQFYFFDGVEIKRYAKRTHTDAVKEAIERTLGIPELRNLVSDVDRAFSTIDTELEKATEANEEIDELNFEISDVEENLQTVRDQIEHNREQKEAAEKTYRQVEQEAQQVQQFDEKLQRLKSQRQQRARFQERLEEQEREIQEQFRKAPVFMLQSYVREAARELESETIRTSRRTGLIRELRKILKKNRCVCDRDLDRDSRQSIEKLLERHESRTGGSTREDVEKKKLEVDLEHIAGLQPANIDEMLNERDRLQDDVETVEQEIASIENELGDIPDRDAQDMWERVGEARADVERLDDELVSLRAEEEKLERKLRELRREREKLASRDATSKTLAYQFRLAEGMRDATQELIDWRLDERRDTIEKHTTELHQRVTNKPDEYVEVILNDDYTLGVKNVYGNVLEPTELSAGEKEALAYAFISALNLASEKGAPFVMDTPFGHLDSEHQQNLVDSLPDLPSQVVVLATDRDFPEELLAGIREQTAQVLTIHRPGRDQSVVEEHG